MYLIVKKIVKFVIMPPNKFEVLKVYTRKGPIVMHNSITMPNMYSSCTVIYSGKKAMGEVPMMPKSFKQLFVSNNWHGQIRIDYKL